MQMELDVVEFNRGYFRAKRVLKAYRETFNAGGVGEVVVSKRKKMPHDTGKVLHGKAIANIQRARGRDAFAYTDQEVDSINEWMNRQFLEMIERVEVTGQPQVEQARMILLWAAQKYEKISRDKVKGRQFKPNSPKYLKYKARMVNAGITMNQYGSPPPPLILTGRYFRGFRSRWRAGPQGRSQGGAVWGIGALLGG
jgi:hypothetical protein